MAAHRKPVRKILEIILVKISLTINIYILILIHLNQRAERQLISEETEETTRPWCPSTGGVVLPIQASWPPLPLLGNLLTLLLTSQPDTLIALHDSIKKQPDNDDSRSGKKPPETSSSEDE